MPTFGSKTETFYIPTEKLIDVMELLNERSSPDSVGAHITVSRPTIKASGPLTSFTDVDNQVTIGGPINDSAALTIANWYAAPQGRGTTFRALVLGNPVPVDELTDAITDELVGREADDVYGWMLHALARWAEGVDAQ